MSWRSSSGMRTWLVQRCSAVYLAIFLLYCAIMATQVSTIGYAQWKSWIAHPVNNVAVALFFLALILHAWVGTRDIVMDYIRPTGLRLLALSILALFLMAMAVWAMKILIMVAV